MKRTWQHRWNRLFRRRGGLPRAAAVPRLSHDPQYRRGAFTRPKFSRYEITFPWQNWLRRAAVAALAVLALWIIWQSWLGLRLFNS
jgi:hypothetical protein